MATTADDVWRLLAELTAAQKETERRFQETERRFQETERRFQETERRFQETERLFREQSQEVAQRHQETERLFREQSQEVAQRHQETERLLREQSQEVAKRHQETERLLREQSQEVAQHHQETERLLREERQKTDRQIKEVSKQIGNLGGKWGRFVENMVAPACEKLFLNRGIPVHQVSQRVKKRLDNNTLEIDVLVTNEDHVLVVEVKSSLGVDDVKELINDLTQFRQFFPEYNQKQLYGAVAGIEIEEGADKYAYRQGLFVLAQAGENLVILNHAQFQPKAW